MKTFSSFNKISSIGSSSFIASVFGTNNANETSTINGTVFVSESGKQFHTIHMECLVTMDVEFGAFNLMREQLNLAAVEYANKNGIQFAEKG